jgi:hypothetical protein
MVKHFHFHDLAANYEFSEPLVNERCVSSEMECAAKKVNVKSSQVKSRQVKPTPSQRQAKPSPRQAKPRHAKPSQSQAKLESKSSNYFIYNIYI